MTTWKKETKMAREAERTAEESSASGLERRSIEAILARRDMRKRRRKETYPPDFVHGEVRLDSVYPVYGEEWVERTAFLDIVAGDDGAMTALTLGVFEGRFLRIEQLVGDEVDDLERWLAERLEGRRRLLKLETGGRERFDMPLPDAVDETSIQCSIERLQELEREELNVVRDKSLERDSHFDNSERRREVLLDSQTNLLSLVGLTARLGIE